MSTYLPMIQNNYSLPNHKSDSLNVQYDYYNQQTASTPYQLKTQSWRNGSHLLSVVSQFAWDVEKINGSCYELNYKQGSDPPFPWEVLLSLRLSVLVVLTCATS